MASTESRELLQLRLAHCFPQKTVKVSVIHKEDRWSVERGYLWDVASSLTRDKVLPKSIEVSL